MDDSGKAPISGGSQSILRQLQPALQALGIRCHGTDAAVVANNVLQIVVRVFQKP